MIEIEWLIAFIIGFGAVMYIIGFWHANRLSKYQNSGLHKELNKQIDLYLESYLADDARKDSALSNRIYRDLQDILFQLEQPNNRTAEWVEWRVGELAESYNRWGK